MCVAGHIEWSQFQRCIWCNPCSILRIPNEVVHTAQCVVAITPHNEAQRSSSKERVCVTIAAHPIYCFVMNDCRRHSIVTAREFAWSSHPLPMSPFETLLKVTNPIATQFSRTQTLTIHSPSKPRRSHSSRVTFKCQSWQKMLIHSQNQLEYLLWYNPTLGFSSSVGLLPRSLLEKLHTD